MLHAILENIKPGFPILVVKINERIVVNSNQSFTKSLPGTNFSFVDIVFDNVSGVPEYI